MHQTQDIDSARLKSEQGQRRSRNFLNSKKEPQSRGFSKKKLSRKLEKLITLYYNQKVGKEHEPVDNILAQHLRNLLSFKHYHSFGRDENSLYRIVGVYHLHWLQSKESEWERMLTRLESQSFDVHMMGNVPQEFMPYFKKDKLLGLYRGLGESLQKKMEKGGNLLRIMSDILNTYTIFDFALIMVYRLYTYYEGFLNLEVELNDILEGTERESLLIYDRAPTEVVIKILSECYRAKINLYSVLNYVDLQFMCYTPSEEFHFELSVMHQGKAYSVLQEKAEQIISPIENSKQADEFSQLGLEADYSHHQYSQVILEFPQRSIRPVRSDVIDPIVMTRHASEHPTHKPQPQPNHQAGKNRVSGPPETQRYVEIKSQQEQLLQEIYHSLSERERKQIVVQHLKRKFQQKFLQVKQSLEREMRRRQEPSHPASAGLYTGTQFRPL